MEAQQPFKDKSFEEGFNMSLQISIPENTEITPKIRVFGVGGAGSNAVNNIRKSFANLEEGVDGVECYVINTDAQALNKSNTDQKLQIGMNVTKGLGAGANPNVGRAAAEESIQEIHQILEGSDMVFITAGMGGGTGTGGAPVIAQIAKEMGILTVAVVTKPFHFEGSRRMKIAEGGLSEIEKYVDTTIVIPNQNLFRKANEKTTFADAFMMADDVLLLGVRGVTDLITMPGLINLDFADIKTVMTGGGRAMMGTGEADGEDRAIKAAEAAISNPLLDNSSMKGAKGVLINITGGMDMTLFEVDEAANRIREEVDAEADIIFGSAFNENLEGKIRVSVVATGIEANANVNNTFERERSKPQQLDMGFGKQASENLEAQPQVSAPPVQQTVNQTVNTENNVKEENAVEKSNVTNPIEGLGRSSGAESFIPPQASQPSGNYFLNNDENNKVGFDSQFISFGINKKQEEAEESLGNDNRKEEESHYEDKAEPKKASGDIFDIPAFIRRRKNKG